MLTLPNALSISRFPIAVSVALTASHHSWGWAFGLLLVGCLTDLADGYVAKRWNLGSKFGAEVLEPVCDLALTAGAIVGLVLTHKLSLIAVAAMVLVAAIVQVINSLFTKTALFTHFGKWFMPLYFLVVIWLLLAWYAYLALPYAAFMVFVALMVIVTIFLIRFKRNRFREWFATMVW